MIILALLLLSSQIYANPISSDLHSRGPPQMTPRCIQSCSDGGNWLQVWDTTQATIKCNGPSPGVCRWANSLQACQAFPQPDTNNGVVCQAAANMAGWCAEAVKQIWWNQPASNCGNGNGGTTGYKCMQSCSDQGHYFQARLNNGKTQCLGSNNGKGLDCIWYGDQACSKPFDPNAGQGQPGVTCDPAANQGWCGEANKQLIQNQPQTSCNGGGGTTGWKCVTSCSDKGHSVKVRNNNGRSQCLGTTGNDCIWYGDAACNQPFVNVQGQPGATCDPTTNQGWCGEANKQLLQGQGQTNCNGAPNPSPGLPQGYTCLQSCSDGLNYVAVTKRPDGKTQCLGIGNACTWYLNPSCTIPTDPTPPIVGQGTICDWNVGGGWCLQANNLLLNGIPPQVCPTPQPMSGWKCLLANGQCGGGAFYYLVNDFGNGGLQCAGGNAYPNSCIAFVDQYCWGTYGPPASYGNSGQACFGMDGKAWCNEAWRVFRQGGGQTNC